MDIGDTMRYIRGTDEERVLLAAHEAGGQIPLSKAQEVAGGERAGVAAAQELRGLGLADPEPRLSGEVTLLPKGQRLAEEINQARINGPERRDAVRRELLRWLDAAPATPPATDAFVGSENASAFGVPFSDQEVVKAGEWLVDNDLVRAPRGAWGMQHLLLPKITSTGIEAIDARGRIADWVRSGGVSSTYEDNRTSIGDHANIGNVANNSRVEHMEATQTIITMSERNEFVDRMAVVLAALPEDAPKDLREHLLDLEASARDESTPRPTLRAKAMQTLVLAAASEAGRAVIEPLGHAVSVFT